MISNKKNTIIKISTAAIAINVVLTAFKMIVGMLDGSLALVSDAVHSLSDVATTVIVIIGAIIASKKSDQCHAYGHERIECLGSILLAFVLGVVGVAMGYQAIRVLIEGVSIKKPSILAIAAAATSIVVKEAMYWHTMHYSKKLKSSSLKADAWHHRSDALSSVASLAGLIFAMFGFPEADPIAGILICLALIKVSVDIFMEASRKLVDHSCDDKTVAEIRAEIEQHPDVKFIDEIKTRMFADSVYTDIEISVDAGLSLMQAHAIAESVHSSLEEKFEYIKHCTVHVNPFEGTTQDGAPQNEKVPQACANATQDSITQDSATQHSAAQDKQGNAPQNSEDAPQKDNAPQNQ